MRGPIAGIGIADKRRGAWRRAIRHSRGSAGHARSRVAALKANEDAALKAFNDEKNKNFRDRDLFVFCFSLPDGNFTAYQSPLMVGTDIRELKLEKIRSVSAPTTWSRARGKATSSPSTTVSQSLDRNSQLPSSRSKRASANRPVALATSSSKAILGRALATRKDLVPVAHFTKHRRAPDLVPAYRSRSV